MMKKAMISILMFAVLSIGVFSNQASVKAKNISVVNKYGFMVLNNGNQRYYSTIVAKVVGMDGKYAVVKNVFDKNDVVYIDKAKTYKGEVVLVTFKHDSVVQVVKNNLNIGHKVEGQKIIK